MPPANRVRYVQSATELSDSWKVEEVAAALGVPYVQVIGHLHLLWWFAANATNESQEQGDLSRFTAETLERRMRWGGDPGALVRALIAFGWLDDSDGQLAVHDWADHSGLGVTRMNQKAARSREWRQRTAPTGTPATETITAPKVPETIGAPDETGSAAVRVLREVLAIGNPDADARRAIANALPDPTINDLAELRRVAEAWKLRGYSRKNLAGVLEWYVGGIPESRSASRPSGERSSAASNMRAIGSALAGRQNNGDQTRTPGRSRFTELLAGDLSPSGRGTGGSSVSTPRLLEGHRTTAVVDG